MRRYRVMAVVLAALVAITVAVVGAHAAGPTPEFWRCVAHGGGEYTDAKCSKSPAEAGQGKYEAKLGVTIEANGFTATDKAAVELQTHGQPFTLTCSGAGLVGKLIVSGAYEAKLKLKGCKSGTEICTSPGAAAKTIVSNALSGTVGWLNEAKFEPGMAFASENGPIAEFECYPPTQKFTAANLQLRGTIIAKVTGNVGVFSKKFTLTIASGAGTGLESFEGGPPEVPSLYRAQGETEEPIEPVHLALTASSVAMLSVR